jgi:propionate CoA-transferase
VVTLGGTECLFYKTFPIDIGIIRAASGDADGNLTMEREALTLEVLAIAMAVRNSGGIVIAQVERDTCIANLSSAKTALGRSHCGR